MEKILAVDLHIKHGNKSQVIKFSDAKERNFAKDIGRNGGCNGMREIKFRGRRKNSSEWVYGAFLAIPKLCSYIYDVQPDGQATRYLVDEDTVGQFTGLLDSNGKEIYEGDIVKSMNGFGVVEYVLDTFLVTWRKPKALEMLNARLFAVASDNADCHVIGNIYDSPELLEEKDA